MTLIELIGRDTALHRVASTHGGEYAGSCPWCGGDDRFRVWPDADKPGYWCRQCDRKGDAIQYLHEHDGLTYRDACEQLGHSVAELPRSQPKHCPQPPPLATPPSPTWQAKARAFIEACEQTLWTPVGAQALAYLHRRGLTDETIRAARLGYHTAERWESPEAWGLPAYHKKIYLLRGIVFPWLVGSELWRATFRRDGDDIPKDKRYRPIAGGSNMLYRVDMLRPDAPVAMVEGPLDALSIAQEAGDLIAVVAAGTTGGRLERWIGRLALASIVLLLFDADAGGDQAAAWWLETLGSRAKRWRPYWDDPNAMLQDGVDLRTWVREGLGLSPQWWRELARWPADRREQWAERAAIMEFDSGLLRDEAEQQAFALLAERAG
jgi:DNA primase